MVRCSTWDLPAALSHLLRFFHPKKNPSGSCILNFLFLGKSSIEEVIIAWENHQTVCPSHFVCCSMFSIPLPWFDLHASAVLLDWIYLSESCDNVSRVCNASSPPSVFCWCTLNACANYDCLSRSICSLPSGCGVRNTSTTSSCPLPSTAPGPRGTRTSTTGRGKQLAFELPQDSFKMSSNDSCLFRLSFSIHQQTQIFLHFQHFRFFLGICVQFFLICCRKRKKVVAERRCKTLWVSSWCIFWFGEVQIRHCREGTTRWPRGQNYMQSSLSCFLNLTEWCWLSLVCV